MSEGKSQFFATCPDCKRKFGINPSVIGKYLTRVLSELDGGSPKSKKKEVKEATESEVAAVKEMLAELIAKKEQEAQE